MGVYFARAGDFVKIGFTSGDPKARLKSLQTGTPLAIKLLHFDPKLTRTDEKRLHHSHRADHFKGEWFHYRGDLKEFIGLLAEGWEWCWNDSPTGQAVIGYFEKERLAGRINEGLSE
jgi:hypothetical protein